MWNKLVNKILRKDESFESYKVFFQKKAGDLRNFGQLTFKGPFLLLLLQLSQSLQSETLLDFSR